MVGEAKYGSDWSAEELDLIVADYFAMLSAEQAGEPYVKAHHSTQLMEQIGRTHRSVESKHMNISAVLEELGRPTIRGYKPYANYQGAILDAIERYLVAEPPAWTVDTPAQLGEPAIPLRWRRKIGQAVKVGSTFLKDGPDDWEAEAVSG